VAWCGRWHHHCVAADVAIAIAILCCLPAVATTCNCISHRATLHIAPLHWWLRCVLCHHGIFTPCKGMPWRCSWGHGDFFVLQHCASCHGMVLCAAALHFMSQHFCATVLCFVPWRFAGVEAFCFVPQHCASCHSIGSSVARQVTVPRFQLCAIEFC